MKTSAHLSILCLIAYACVSSPTAEEQDYLTLQGETMGTYYQVTYLDSLDRNFQREVDSLLAAINMEVSTYIDTSTISFFNRAEEKFDLGFGQSAENAAATGKRHFWVNLLAAREVFEKSGGAFDPTVMPLVNYWGFGYSEKKQVTSVDSAAIDSLMQFVGFNKVKMDESGQAILVKEKPGVQLDFSGCAKGYGVDAVGRWLEQKGIGNYLVDIGGEARAKGLSPRGDAWNIGINVPREDAGFAEIQTAMPLRDQSVATSGNYRNFYEVNGVKYSHTINPWTGYPERNKLLSASVLAKDCMIADAYATAFMVLGPEKALELASRLPGIEAYFIFSKEDGAMEISYTDGLKGVIKE
jgi:FAD:protein FMN transferase